LSPIRNHSTKQLLIDLIFLSLHQSQEHYDSRLNALIRAFAYAQGCCVESSIGVASVNAEGRIV